MINWDKTKQIFGYNSCKGIQQVVVVCAFCSNDKTVTKNRYYQNRKRNNGQYRCFECSKEDLSERTSVAIRKKWQDKQYRMKQESRRHSDEFKRQASEKSKQLWADEQYIVSYREGFDPDKARQNLQIARKKAAVVWSAKLKHKWQDKEYRQKMSTQSAQLWQDKSYRDGVINHLRDNYTVERRLYASKVASELWTNKHYRENWLVSFLDSLTDERRREIAVRSVKNWTSDAYREKIDGNWSPEKRAWMSAVCAEWWSDDKRAEISELMLLRWSDAEWRSRCIRAFVDSWTQERRQKSRDWWTPERRQEASERSRLLWKDPAYVQKYIEMLGQPSSLEEQFAKILADYNVDFEQQVHIGPYLFDFRIGDKLIEIQGDYWHKLDRTVIKDKAKATYIERYFPDLKLLYVWEHEFYELEKIRNFVEAIISKPKMINFSLSDVKVEETAYSDAKCLFEKYHYKSSIGRGGLVIGARLGIELIAGCVFATPTREVKGGELTRFVIHPRYQKKNFASWFLSRATKKGLARFGSLFTFADPNFNHNGTIYLASNWVATGETRPDYWYVSMTGWVMHKKTLWNRAVNLGMKETEFAAVFGYRKVWGLPKKKYVMAI